MSKCMIRVRIDNPEESKEHVVPAILQNSILKYKEDKNTTVTWNYETQELRRETKDLKLKYCFQEKEGWIETKEPHHRWKVSLQVKKIERKGNNIQISFQVEENQMNYRIEEIK